MTRKTSKSAAGSGAAAVLKDLVSITATPDSPMHVRALVAYREIALTFGGTNLGEGEALPQDATVIEVENMLRTFPQEMVNEIWIAIGEAFPKWGPADPNAL